MLSVVYNTNTKTINKMLNIILTMQNILIKLVNIQIKILKILINAEHSNNKLRILIKELEILVKMQIIKIP